MNKESTLKLTFDTNVTNNTTKNIDELSNALERLDKLDLSNINNIVKSLSAFKTIKIPVSIGTSVVNLANSLQSLSNIPDISTQASNLNTGFAAIATAVKNFEGVSAKIPVSLGKGVTGIVNAINQISTIKDISGIANTLNNNFAIIAQAVSHFNELNNVNYVGIAKLVTAMTSINKVKAIDSTVIKNAEMLAKAINVLNSRVTADTPRLQAMATVVNKLGTSFNNASNSSNRFGNSLKLINMAAFVSLARQGINVLGRLVGVLNTSVASYGELQNSMAFFGQSLGENTQEVGNNIAEWGNLGLVDFSSFTNNVAVLNQMLRGYGIASKDAAKMSQNLTQMAYDASYSLGKNGQDLEMWLERTQSLMAGQARVGYQFGIDTTVKALSENFDGLSNNSAKAAKAMAVYATVLDNTKAIQGQYSRELNTTYVQMSILKNQMNTMVKSIGNALAPLFLELIKVAMVALKVIVLVIDAVAKLFGGSFEMINYKDALAGTSKSSGNVADNANTTADGMEDATKAAKELKKTISSIDQVFTINDKVEEASNGLNNLNATELGMGNIQGYDFIDAAAMALLEEQMADIDKKAQDIFNSFKDIVPIVATIGAGILSWKIAKTLLDGIMWLKSLQGMGLNFNINASAIGLLAFIGDLKDFMKWIKDIQANGATFKNVSGIIGTFLQSVGDAFIFFGASKIGGSIKIVGEVVELAANISDIAENGANYENVMAVIRNISGIGIAIGAMTGNWKLAGVSLAIEGLTRIITELGENWEAIKKGDWSGVDKASLVIGAIQIIGGIAVALGALDKIKGIRSIGKTAKTITDVSTTTETVTNTTGKLFGTLKSLAKNLAIGLVILVEVAAAALIIVGTIILLGMALEQVGKAWEPVILNGKTVLIAMGIGVGILLVFGAITATLGKAGTQLIVSMALGIAVLALIGVSVGIFVLEIWAIGKGLEQIGVAWQPVLDNSETIILAIKLGTALLISIGGVCALLGVAAVASVGLLPLAIALGTAMLLELGVAVVAFLVEIIAIGKCLNQINTAWKPVLGNGEIIEYAISKGTELLISIGGVCALLGVAAVASVGLLPLAIALGTKMLVSLGDSFVMFVISLVKVSNSLSNDLHPALSVLVSNLPAITSNMTAFVNGMTYLAEEFARYTGISAISGLVATVDTIIGWFTVDPIKKMSDDVKKQEKSFESLSNNLSTIIPYITNSANGMITYEQMLITIKESADKISSIEDMPLIGQNINEFSNSLYKAFEILETIKTENVSNIVAALLMLDLSRFAGIGRNMAVEIELGLNNYKYNFTMLGNNILSSLIISVTNKGTTVGVFVAKDLTHAINNYRYDLTEAGESIEYNLTIDGKSIGYNIASGVVNGINGTSVNLSSFVMSIKSQMTNAFDIHSPSRWAEKYIGNMIGAGSVIGINETKVDLTPFENNIKGAFDNVASMSEFKPITVPIDSTIDTTKINGDLTTATNRINANVNSNYSYTDETTTDAINTQTEETISILNELLSAVKNNSFIIDYKGVSRRVTEEQNNDKNIRNVRTPVLVK